MKVARFVLKIISLALAAVAIACCVIAYWDKICDFVSRIGEKMREKRANCPLCSSEYEDYADWD